MARLAGVTIPDNKKIEFALPYIYGVGHVLSRRILLAANIDGNKRTRELTPEELNRLRQIIEKEYKVEGELRRTIMFNVKRLKDIGAYRGIRHAKHLPVRGQRTKTNSRTVRGNVRRTAGSGKIKGLNKT